TDFASAGKAREMEGKGAGGSKQTPTKNLDAPVTKGELGNDIKRIMSEHLPSILAQSKENLKKEEEARKAVEEAERRRKAMKDKRATDEQERKRKAEQDRKNAEEVENEETQKPKETDEIEDIFEISECSSRKRVKYASHLLKGEARPWWDMIKIARGDDVASVITWEECKKPGHKIADCPERKPQEPQEEAGYNGKRVEYNDTQSQKTMGRVFQLTTKNA
nr:hypothetical protein [Tanacetum cinerariifolium]